MPRYFSDVSSHNSRVKDEKGYEFACVADAYFYARRIVLETQLYLNEEDGRWTIRIQSPNEEFELIVLFPAARAAAHSPTWFGRRYNWSAPTEGKR